MLLFYKETGTFCNMSFGLMFFGIKNLRFIIFLYFCSRKELLGSKRMQIAEFRTVAKSLPLLR